jgi:thioredoxin reductase
VDAEIEPSRDVCIIGGGPAGLSAALVLGRCRREVLVVDSGKPRNGASRALHGFLSRDGTSPLELRGLGREQLKTYRTVELRQDVVVTSVERRDDRFVLTTSDGRRPSSRILLLATGREDLIPTKHGFREYYGRGVYHCPHCDGWEHRDEPLVVYGNGESGFDLALTLLVWSRNVTVCTDGPATFSAAQGDRLKANGVGWREEEVRELRGDDAAEVAAVVFANGRELECAAVFFCSDCRQRSRIPESLGCRLDAEGSVLCDGHAATNVPGLFVAGNVRGGIHLAIVAAAEGAEAALAINRTLHEQSLK